MSVVKAGIVKMWRDGSWVRVIGFGSTAVGMMFEAVKMLHQWLNLT